jgi:hypothetical protein
VVLSGLWIRIRSDPELLDQVYRYGPGSDSPLMDIFCIRQCFRIELGIACFVRSGINQTGTATFYKSIIY